MSATGGLIGRYMGATTFGDMVAGATKNQELWRAVAARARVPDDLLARAAAVEGRWHLLVLSEDWCGDAVNTVPAIARLAELAPNLELRVVARDANPDLMDAHLTDGTRSIPLVILLDDVFEERGRWGPRPRPLQEWVLSDGQRLPKEERYREIRRWYARDRARTTLEELVAVLERAGDPAGTPAAGSPIALAAR
jgi:hypothetical protein